MDLNAGYGRGYSDNTNTRALGNHHTNILTYTQSELRLRQMIFDGFNTANEVERTQGVVNSRAYYAQGTAQDLALRTIEVYLEVLKRRELVTLAKNNLQAHLRVNDQIGLRTQRGVGEYGRLRPVQRPSGPGGKQLRHRPGRPGRRRDELLQRGRAHAR